MLVWHTFHLHGLGGAQPLLRLVLVCLAAGLRRLVTAVMRSHSRQAELGEEEPEGRSDVEVPELVPQKVASELHPKVRNHGEGPY